MSIKDSWALKVIDRFIKTLIALYLIGYLFLAIFLVLGYIFKRIYNTIDYILYHLTGIKSLRPELNKRSIKLDSVDGFMIPLFVILALGYYYVIKPQDEEEQRISMEAQNRVNAKDYDNQNASLYDDQSTNSANTTPIQAANNNQDIVVRKSADLSKVQTTDNSSYRDTIALINQQNSGYIVSDKLPLTYSRGLQKWVFRKQDTLILVDSYYNGGKCATYIGRQQDNIIAITQSLFFTCNKGIVKFNSSLDNSSFQLYESKN